SCGVESRLHSGFDRVAQLTSWRRYGRKTLEDPRRRCNVDHQIARRAERGAEVHAFLRRDEADLTASSRRTARLNEKRDLGETCHVLQTVKLRDNGPVFGGSWEARAPLTEARAMLRSMGSLCGTRKRANIESRTMLKPGGHPQPW